MSLNVISLRNRAQKFPFMQSVNIFENFSTFVTHRTEEVLNFVHGLDSVGVISQEGSFGYLKLSKSWQNIADVLLSGVSESFKYNKILKSNQAKLRRYFENSGVDSKKLEFKFYKPLSSVGLHVSLEGVTKADLDRKIRFEVKDLIIQRANIGIPSRHNPTIYHCQWFALLVNLLPSEDNRGQLPFSKGRAHISIACNGVDVKGVSGKGSSSGTKHNKKKKNNSESKKNSSKGKSPRKVKSPKKKKKIRE